MRGLLSYLLQHLMGRRHTAAALFVCTIVPVAGALCGTAMETHAAAKVATDPFFTSSIPASQVPHELKIKPAPKGAEGLELAARLHEGGGLIVKPINWKIRQIGPSAGGLGALSYDHVSPTADLILNPGRYRIEASYGHAKAIHYAAVEPGQRLGLTLILNVGGLRTLSSLHGLSTPEKMAITHSVYALDGAGKDHLITKSAVPGEILRLPSGAYRVESRIRPGNAVVQVHVKVKAGILRSVQIAHQAALARIKMGNGARKWTLRDAKHPWTFSAAKSTDVVLVPGKYIAETSVNGRIYRREFVAEAGKTSTISLTSQATE